MRDLMASILFLTALAAAPSAEPKPIPAPVVPHTREAIEPLMARHLQQPRAVTMASMLAADHVPAYRKPAIRDRAARDPWSAMTDLEGHGLALAELARRGTASIPAELDRLAAKMGLKFAATPSIPRTKLVTLAEHADHIGRVFDEALRQRDAAIQKAAAKDRSFAFNRAAPFIETFRPQQHWNDLTQSDLRTDRVFFGVLTDQTDLATLTVSAKVLATLTDAEFLASLRAALEAAAPLKERSPRVTGDVLFRRATPHGLIIFGGAGQNSYDLAEPVAFLADLGGNDTYRGVLASSTSIEQPFGVLIDFGGDDRYEPSELGLATGRLGVGLLFDLAGNDRYILPRGCAGVGIGGIGILCDVSGNDTYTGSRFTLGAAVAGIGLLHDLSGDDTYTSHVNSIGLGGPGGIAAVIDVAGHDSYQCGNHDPSPYNETDAPNALPGSASFQYDAFGLGAGVGRRCLPRHPDADPTMLGGGIGILLDLSGNDRYRGSNFSQGCGYFFGIGLKMDLDGDDQHTAARYGFGSGAHYGMGLHLDYAGGDTYDSTGPTYNCGCSWDRSQFLFIDAVGDDTYNLTRSSGPARADIGSWAVFADLTGKDRYRINDRPGQATQEGLAVFYEGDGDDEYPPLRMADPPTNRKLITATKGALFMDR